jgi:peptidyl-dipeptidase Dcp
MTATPSHAQSSPAGNAATASASANPLLAPWAGPYGGVPPFDKVQVNQFKPALEAAMAENLREIDAIANNKQAATFENTIAALEKAGQRLDEIQTVYGIWSGTLSTPEVQGIEREMSPRMAAFRDKINQNEALFKRVEAVYNSPDKKKLTPEQQRLSWLYYNNLVRAGAKLDAKAKTRLSAINQQLAGLFTKFSQNVLADETDRRHGRPAHFAASRCGRRGGCAQAYRRRGHYQHSLVHRAVSDLFRPAQAARKGLAHVLQPRR